MTGIRNALHPILVTESNIDDGLQAVQEVRRMVGKAIHAAVTWVGLCLGLGVCV